MATLTLKLENKILNTYKLDPGKKIHIGRSGENDIIINNKGVSAKHASITFDGTGYVIKDMGSRNGISVAGKTVKSHRFSHGEIVNIGPYHLDFEDQNASPETKRSPGPVTLVLDELDQMALESKMQNHKNMAPERPEDNDKKALLIVKFKDKVLYNHLLEDENTGIGRGADNTIVFDNPAVSTNHAMVYRKGNDYVISDLNSKNGTFVNEKKISDHTLHEGDVVVIGRHELVFKLGAETDHSSSKPHLSMDSAVTPDPTQVLDTRKYKDLLHRSKGEMATGKAELAYISGGSGKVPIRKNVVSIGSAKECDIVVKGLLVGENAAFILIKDDGYYLTYNKGLAKPVVNGEKLSGSRKLYDGDLIKIGSVTLQFGL